MAIFGSRGEAHKVLQKARAGSAAFFRMKLRGEDISAFEDRGEICAVSAGRNDFIRGRGSRESMREIEIVGFGQAREQHRWAFDAKTVPSHMRKFDGARKRTDLTRE